MSADPTTTPYAPGYDHHADWEAHCARKDAEQAAPRTYEVREVYGHWIVQTKMGCINGLAAWVQIADCGERDETDQMCGYDPKEWAHRIADALEAAHGKL